MLDLGDLHVLPKRLTTCLIRFSYNKNLYEIGYKYSLNVTQNSQNKEIVGRNNKKKKHISNV